jgi:hypothetical protein
VLRLQNLWPPEWGPPKPSRALACGRSSRPGGTRELLDHVADIAIILAHRLSAARRRSRSGRPRPQDEHHSTAQPLKRFNRTPPPHGKAVARTIIESAHDLSDWCSGGRRCPTVAPGRPLAQSGRLFRKSPLTKEFC